VRAMAGARVGGDGEVGGEGGAGAAEREEPMARQGQGRGQGGSKGEGVGIGEGGGKGKDKGECEGRYRYVKQTNRIWCKTMVSDITVRYLNERRTQISDRLPPGQKNINIKVFLNSA